MYVCWFDADLHVAYVLLYVDEHDETRILTLLFLVRYSVMMIMMRQNTLEEPDASLFSCKRPSSREHSTYTRLIGQFGLTPKIEP